ncbi:hypothetical protein D3C80_1291120 [compost metagenome]
MAYLNGYFINTFSSQPRRSTGAEFSGAGVDREQCGRIISDQRIVQCPHFSADQAIAVRTAIIRVGSCGYADVTDLRIRSGYPVAICK